MKQPRKNSKWWTVYILLRDHCMIYLLTYSSHEIKVDKWFTYKTYSSLVGIGRLWSRMYLMCDCLWRYPTPFEILLPLSVWRLVRHKRDAYLFQCRAGVLVFRLDLSPSPPSAAYMRQWIRSALVNIMACFIFGAKPLYRKMLVYGQLDPEEQTSSVCCLPFVQMEMS